MPLKIAIIGAKGRMGQVIASVAAECDCEIIASLDQGDDLLQGCTGAQAIIDFSFHKVTEHSLAIAKSLGIPIVIGTTGHTSEEKKVLAELASSTRCVWAGNYSVGVNLLFALTRRAASVLGKDYDAEVIEMHHRFKKDAPSGTAARLLEVILEERKLNAEALRHGREGITGERTQAEVGIHAVRGGDVVGDHTVIFAALGERVELTHKASDRGIFARGALRAAHWLQTQKAGLYDMQDVLGLK
ncbi:MAG: 4-hydroxy-tetrahydrodipicolinate reductase [Opitutaceae bacterium]|nr:4-hydroxy-tetrahydrodipicolinate reductase [Opitutaceae bacterium]